MYLYCTYALFTLPLAVKFDGPLRCIVAVCVVSDEVKRNVTCRLETRAPYSSLTSRTCRSVMSKLQCGSSRLVLGGRVVCRRARRGKRCRLESHLREPHSAQPAEDNHKPDAMQLFFESKPNHPVLSSLRTPSPVPAPAS